jgi:hypothetical protein
MRTGKEKKRRDAAHKVVGKANQVGEELNPLGGITRHLDGSVFRSTVQLFFGSCLIEISSLKDPSQMDHCKTARHDGRRERVEKGLWAYFEKGPHLSLHVVT